MSKLIREYENNGQSVSYFILSFLVDWLKKQTGSVNNKPYKPKSVKRRGSLRSRRSVRSVRSLNEISQSDIASVKKQNTPSLKSNSTIKEVYYLLEKVIIEKDVNSNDKLKAKATEGFDLIVLYYDMNDEFAKSFDEARNLIDDKDSSVYTIFVLQSIAKKKLKASKSKGKVKEKPVLEKMVRSDYLIVLQSFLKGRLSNIERAKYSNLFNHFYMLLLSILNEAKRLKQPPDDKMLMDLIRFSLFTKSSRLRSEAITFIQLLKETKIKVSLFPQCFSIPEDFQEKEAIDSGFILTFIKLFISENERENNISPGDTYYSPNIFNVSKGIDKLKGVDELWSFIQHLDNQAAYRIADDFISVLYKSFSLTAGNGVLKKFGNHFVNNLVSNIETAYATNDEKAINRLLKTALRVLSNLKGLRAANEGANMHSSIDIVYKKEFYNVATRSNVTLFEIVNLFKENNRFKNNFQPILKKRKITHFSALELITAYKVGTEQNKQGFSLAMQNIGKIVDLDFYKEFVFTTLSKDKRFYDVIEKILFSNSDEYKDNLKQLMSLLPPHEMFNEYFKEKFSKKGNRVEDVLKEQTNHVFKMYIIRLDNGLKKENNTKKRLIGKFLCQNYYPAFVDYYLKYAEAAGREANSETRTYLLDILFNAVNYQEKPSLSERQAERVYESLFEFFKELNEENQQSHEKKLFVIVKGFFLLVYLKHKSLFTVLQDIQAKILEYSKISEYLILNILKVIQTYPVKNLTSKQVEQIFRDEKKIIHNEYALVYVKLFLKIKDVKSLNLKNKSEIEKLLYRILLKIKKSEYPDQFVYQSIEFFIEGFKSDLYDYFSEMIVNWLDFYFFQTNKNNENYEFYFNLITKRTNLNQLFQFINNFVENNKENGKSLIRIIAIFIAFQKHRGNSKNEWHIIKSINSQHKENKFRGLINCGNTCYINSSIQQIYMIDEFVSFITKLDLPDDNTTLNKVS